MNSSLAGVSAGLFLWEESGRYGILVTFLVPFLPERENGSLQGDRTGKTLPEQGTGTSVFRILWGKWSPCGKKLFDAYEAKPAGVSLEDLMQYKYLKPLKDATGDGLYSLLS